MWSRRQVLAAMGSAAASSMVAGFAGACRAQVASRPSTGPATDPAQGLEQLLGLVDQHFSEAFVWSRRVENYHISVDSGEERFDQGSQQWIVIGGRRGGTQHSAAYLGLPADELLRAVQTFLTNFGKRPKAAAMELPRLQQWGDEYQGGLQDHPPAAFREPVIALFEQAQSLGGSRIVFRGSYLDAQSSDHILMSREHHHRIHSLRSRGGVMMAAWTGDDLASAHTQVAALGGPEIVKLPTSSIDNAAQDALSQLHARSAPSGMQEIILSPETSALVAYHAFAQSPPLMVQAPQALRIIDDARSGYASFKRDDLGQKASVSVLVGQSAAKNAPTPHLRRDQNAMLRHMPSNVIVEPGEKTLDDLVAGVTRGVLLGGPLHCSVDPRHERLALVCSQGREIVNGRFTGRRFSRLLVSAARQEFAMATRGLSGTSTLLAFEAAGLPVSASAPHWLTQAQVDAG